MQIVYNVLVGNSVLSSSNKKKLKAHKTVIQRFVSRELPQEKRKELLLKYFKQILILVVTVVKKL